MIRPISPPQSKNRRPSGTTMVEAAFSIIVLLGFIFLILSVSWGIFAKVTLQHAVRSGVRYAVTSPNDATAKSLGQVAAIQQVVRSQSMGFLSATDLSLVKVHYFSTTSSALTELQASNPLVTANEAGNLIVVSVEGWSLSPLVKMFGTAPLHITVSSGDLIEWRDTTVPLTKP